MLKLWTTRSLFTYVFPQSAATSLLPNFENSLRTVSLEKLLFLTVPTGLNLLNITTHVAKLHVTTSRYFIHVLGFVHLVSVYLRMFERRLSRLSHIHLAICHVNSQLGNVGWCHIPGVSVVLNGNVLFYLMSKPIWFFIDSSLQYNFCNAQCTDLVFKYIFVFLNCAKSSLTWMRQFTLQSHMSCRHCLGN